MKQEDSEIIKTDVWVQYEKNVQYNRLKKMYEKTKTNYKMYHSDQWEHLESGDMEAITFNIIKPIVKYKVGIINSNAYQIVYSPNNYETKEFQNEMKELCKHLNKHNMKVWELEQAERKIREAVKDSCINSEGIIYSFNQENEDGKNEKKVQVIDKTNICYGNENDEDIQTQPYIIISFRKTLEEVKDEARANGVSEEDIKLIVSDNEVDEQSGYDNYEEITPMCLMLLKLYKKNGRIHSVKSTRTVVIQEETNHNLKYYPVAHITWEDEKGNARGLGEVEYLIANQREINKTAMRRAISVKLCAYPQNVVLIDQIANPESLNQIGSTIKIKGQTVQDVTKAVGRLQPTAMATDSEKLQSELMTNTRELAGAGENATGNVDPTQASGKAILAVQQASQQPLTEQSSKFKVFVEDIARIWFDLDRAYSTDGMEILVTEENENGEEVEIPYVIPNTVLEALRVNIKIDVTPKSPFDKYAQELSLENLMTTEKITFEEYVESLDDDSTMPKPKLVEILKKREEKKAEIEQMQMQVQEQQAELQARLREQQAQEETTNNEIDDIQKQGNTQYDELVGGSNDMQPM